MPSYCIVQPSKNVQQNRTLISERLTIWIELIAMKLVVWVTYQSSIIVTENMSMPEKGLVLVFSMSHWIDRGPPLDRQSDIFGQFNILIIHIWAWPAGNKPEWKLQKLIYAPLLLPFAIRWLHWFCFLPFSKLQGPENIQQIQKFVLILSIKPLKNQTQ